jgi:hypothetical protein
MISEFRVGRKQSWRNFRYHLDIYLEGEENHENLNPDADIGPKI